MLTIRVMSGLALIAIPIVMCVVCYVMGGGDMDDK